MVLPELCLWDWLGEAGVLCWKPEPASSSCDGFDVGGELVLLSSSDIDAEPERDMLCFRKRESRGRPSLESSQR